MLLKENENQETEATFISSIDCTPAIAVEVSAAKLVDARDCGRGALEDSRGHDVHGVFGITFFAGVRCKIAAVAGGGAAVI